MRKRILSRLQRDMVKENKAGYTATSCGWVGRGGNARFYSFRLNGYGRTDQQTDGRTDGRTNGRTDRRTDRRTGKASYKVACVRPKK